VPSFAACGCSPTSDSTPPPPPYFSLEKFYREAVVAFTQKQEVDPPAGRIVYAEPYERLAERQWEGGAHQHPEGLPWARRAELEAIGFILHC